MNYKLSTQLKSERGIYLALTALNPKRLEVMITDAEAIEKQVKDLKEGNKHSIITFENLIKNIIQDDKAVADLESNISYLTNLLND